VLSPKDQENIKIKLNFNHPVKELIWTVRDNRNTSVQTLLAGAGPVAYDFSNYAVNATGAIVGNVAVGGAGGGDAVFGSALYGGVNPSRRPSSSSMPTIDSASVMENTSIKCSLISITPCRLSVSTCTPSHKPRAPAAGSCNMSRIDNATLQLQLAKMSEGSQVSREL
jgi:hypothetical protein